MEETFLSRRRALFWDINEKEIDKALIHSSDWVVNRVFEYGSIEDIREVIRFYKADNVKRILEHSPLKPLTRAMAYLFLGIDKDGRYAV
ncbi:MAG: hypothetical protein JST48_02240 [Bacteroidetes bacterium]|nr:hypothetical protein [Bacteroidota bacterium]